MILLTANAAAIRTHCDDDSDSDGGRGDGGGDGGDGDDGEGGLPACAFKCELVRLLAAMLDTASHQIAVTETVTPANGDVTAHVHGVNANGNVTADGDGFASDSDGEEGYGFVTVSLAVGITEKQQPTFERGCVATVYNSSFNVPRLAARRHTGTLS
ncbi:hypothetical protein T492DRAFT_156979 [Pavlovales sp. CCMP2436]|nr:hypothetical protein T492DRAFT_156979 [Pavlovales sp. CCMP2436]